MSIYITLFRVVGASGNVGREMVRQLLDAGVHPDQIQVMASYRSVGKFLEIQGNQWTLQAYDSPGLQEKTMRPVIYLLATDEAISKSLVPKITAMAVPGIHQVILDSSSAYRLDPAVPLIVGPLNQRLISWHHGLHAHGNCIAVPLSLVLNAFMGYTLRHSFVTTFQSAAGAGQEAVHTLCDQTRGVLSRESFDPLGLEVDNTPCRAFNVVPFIGGLLPSGFTTEELKIKEEVSKILDRPIPCEVTAVRVPTLRGHSFSLWLQLEEDPSLDTVIQGLQEAPGIWYWEAPPTPLEALGQDRVLVGRVYKAAAGRFHVWACSDNLRRGAATDSVETALYLAQTVP